MKTAYIVNSAKYPYHRIVAEDFAKIIPGDLFDIAKYEYQTINEVEAGEYDVVIVFDLVANDFRTTSDTLVINKLTAKIVTILFRKIEEYEAVGYRQNLSSFMYISKRDDIKRIRQRYIEVPNIEYFPEFMYKADSSEEHERNLKCIKEWWLEYKKEAMIYETVDI